MLRHLIAPAILACLLSATPAAATQEYILPTLFDVTGVASDDSLNIRADPNSSSEIIGILPPDATGIEVVEERDGWGRVNSSERSGWVSMRFLSYRTDVWEAGKLPADFRCLGTEPFWNLDIDHADNWIMFQEIEQVAPAELRAILDTGIFRDPTRAIIGQDMTILATPQLCSDGMSDRMYGLRATVIEDGETPRMLNGCCMIQPRDR